MGTNVPIWTLSSVGESNRLITGRSWVRTPEGPLGNPDISKVDYSRPRIVGSSPTNKQ